MYYVFSAYHQDRFYPSVTLHASPESALEEVIRLAGPLDITVETIKRVNGYASERISAGPVTSAELSTAEPKTDLMTMLTKAVGMCQDCGKLFDHDIDEPFANCDCGTSEWTFGHIRNEPLAIRVSALEFTVHSIQQQLANSHR